MVTTYWRNNETGGKRHFIVQSFNSHPSLIVIDQQLNKNTKCLFLIQTTYNKWKQKSAVFWLTSLNQPWTCESGHLFLCMNYPKLCSVRSYHSCAEKLKHLQLILPFFYMHIKFYIHMTKRIYSLTKKLTGYNKQRLQSTSLWVCDDISLGKLYQQQYITATVKQKTKIRYEKGLTFRPKRLKCIMEIDNSEDFNFRIYKHHNCIRHLIYTLWLRKSIHVINKSVLHKLYEYLISVNTQHKL